MTKRRGRGEGTYYQRPDGVWVAQVSLGKDADGKRRRLTVYGSSRDEVRAKVEAEGNTPLSALDTAKETVGELMTRWLTVVETQLGPNTYDCYKTQVDLRIKPHLGGIAVRKLTADHMWMWFGSLRREGVSPRVLQLSRFVLRTALNTAGHWDRICAKPEDKKRLKAPKVARKKPLVWDEDQSRKFVGIVRGHVFEALFYLAVTSAMRIGELLALQWSDIDWNNGAINVHRTLLQVRGKILGVKEGAKTESGERAIAITAPVLAVLKAHRTRQQQERLRAGLPMSQYVFVTRPGDRRLRQNKQAPEIIAAGFLLRQSVQRALTRLCKRHGLPRLTVHQLRHTHLTLLLKAGVHPKVAQERAGHSDVSITLSMYSHVMPGMQAEAANKLDAILAQPPAPADAANNPE